jgi:membrane associated rhomboid family serine protease
MESVIILTTSILGVVLTFYVSTKMEHGAVGASAGLSLIVGIFFYLFPAVLSPYLTHNIPLAFMGASFVGMVSEKIIQNYWILALAGIMYSILYLNTGSYFEGFGGALGTTASISVIVIMGIGILQKGFIKISRANK